MRRDTDLNDDENYHAHW